MRNGVLARLAAWPPIEPSAGGQLGGLAQQHVFDDPARGASSLVSSSEFVTAPTRGRWCRARLRCARSCAPNRRAERGLYDFLSVIIADGLVHKRCLLLSRRNSARYQRGISLH